jgi:hypothetical protein
MATTWRMGARQSAVAGCYRRDTMHIAQHSTAAQHRYACITRSQHSTHLQKLRACAEVACVELVRHVPTDGPKLVPLLHHAVQEAHHKQQLPPLLPAGQRNTRQAAAYA